MPSRFWINPIQYHSSDHYLAGGVRVYPCIISAENVSVLVTWTDGKQSCPKMWDAHKVCSIVLRKR
ncbi:hypothetical protein DL93DRAFT_2073262 [Clavulina sp. PMI_390]|nr:hypothetical protein DL93DRAFT_2073262 [Clavulina sp. PMI_390]